MDDIERIRAIAAKAWQGAANAHRMYPQNKHTFSNYWDAAASQFKEFLQTDQTQILVWVSSNSKGQTRFLSFSQPKVCQNNSGVWYDYSADFSKARMISKDEFNQFGLQPGELGVFELRRVE